MAEKRIRCAIYTRKSTEEGLDKEFNTLDAQREACEAYIKSQMHEGWELVPASYDDGGYTGGNMDRPALQALMTDINAGRIDVVVVYKVDRLSRSLHDFAQMVAVFDAKQVSFVSITQQFNTTTSMGRLTLNILLSFAQFEREVIGERVRDKFAASKKKGMWMGGCPPLGYDIEHRKLVVNEKEAPLIQEIFELYPAVRSGHMLAGHLNRKGHRNKRWVAQTGKVCGGGKFTYQSVYKLLNNPNYIGYVRHKDKLYEGQHDAIISQELWDEAHTIMKKGREKRAKRHVRRGTLLEGKGFSPTGEIYTPTYTSKNPQGIHYRYYVLRSTNKRIAAHVIETLVGDTIATLAEQPEHWQLCWSNGFCSLAPEEAQHRWQSLWKFWPALTSQQKRDIADLVIRRIIISDNELNIRLDYQGIIDVLDETREVKIDDVPKPMVKVPDFLPKVRIESEYLDVTIAAQIRTFGRTQLAVDEDGKAVTAIQKTQYDAALVNAIVRSYQWNDLLQYGEMTITELANKHKLARSYVSSILNLKYLAPDIIKAIFNGTQPQTLKLKHLMQNLPIRWNEQRSTLKFQ